MIQILLDKDKQKECEEIFLKYMEEILPFYSSEIYGDVANDKNSVSEEKEEWIKKTRRVLWEKNKTLYRYLYLPRMNSEYPKEQEVEAKRVYQDRLRRLLVGPEEGMVAGKRREKLKEIISEIGPIENDSVLKEIFLYQKFSDSQEAKQILKILDMDVCPYCNRTFTITVEKGKMNGKGKGIRPEFDHYFPRKYYPYLAVNLYNLIPACGICNKFKSYHDTYKEPILYPYDEGLGDEYIFTSYPKSGSMLYLRKFMSQEDFMLRIEPNLKQIYKNDILSVRERKELEERIARSIKILHLEEIYLAHANFTADILRNRYIFSEEYIKILQKKFPDVNFSIQDVKKVLYCCDIQIENWGKHILTKLIHDMDAEIADMEDVISIE